VPPRSHALHHPLPALLDVEQFRSLPERHAVARRMIHPTLVLGSTQRAEVVLAAPATENGVAVVRRRGGGGAVLLQPGDHLWVEAWIPRDDPLWAVDIAESAAWVGAWWRTALEARGHGGLTVHAGPSAPGPHGALVCFSGRGPGEVFSGDRKVMGVSQWRSREGSLFHTSAYGHWDPLPLIDLLDVDAGRRKELRRDLPRAALGLADLPPTGSSLAEVEETLLSSFPTWSEKAPR
jgi:lipoate-protein ligase A